MAITSSEIIEDRAQIDGRRFIRERHTDDIGNFHYVTYIAGQEENVQTILSIRAALIETMLIDQEHESNLNKVANQENILFAYTTTAQFLVRLKILYSISVGLKATIIGKYFHTLDLSDAVLRSLFNIVQAQVAGLRTKFSEQNDLINNVQSQNGVYP